MKKFEAGVIDGHDFAAWSSHSSQDLAEAAARKYARSIKQRTGGAGEWSGWVRCPDGRMIEVPR